MVEYTLTRNNLQDFSTELAHYPPVITQIKFFLQFSLAEKIIPYFQVGIGKVTQVSQYTLLINRKQCDARQ